MLNSTRSLFYVNHPSVEGKADFNQHCPRGEQTIVLGCYVKNRGIYIYNVTDKRLAGIEEVTGAHELLHAEYDRLTKGELEEVNDMLRQAYKELKDNRIRKNIAAYQRAGADVLNELHSILGTEVRDLPPPLENYYRHYFSDRSKIVALSENYESFFTDLKQRAAVLQARLNQLKLEINRLSSELQARRAELESKRGTISSKQEADSFNTAVRSYNSDLAHLNDLIAQYNNLVKQYQQLIVEQSQLYKAINAQTSPF